MLIVNAHQTPEFLVEVNQKIVQFLIENDAHAHVMDFFSPQTRQILDEFLIAFRQILLGNERKHA